MKKKTENIDLGLNIHKIPPQNLDAEIAVLRVIFFNNETIKAIRRKILSDKDFYRNAHSLIYKTILKILDSGRPVDFITLQDQLRKDDKLDSIGGSFYLDKIFLKEPTMKDNGYSSKNLEYYAHIVLEKSLLRQIIMIATDIMVMAYQEDLKIVLRDIQRMQHIIRKLSSRITNLRKEVKIP